MTGRRASFNFLASQLFGRRVQQRPPGAPREVAPPPPLTLPWLASVDLMERLSYYGMSAILMLYLTASPAALGVPGPGLGYSTADAAGIAGSYSALVFLTPLLGGWVADRWLGSSLAVLLGACVITLGHALMAMPLTPTFWLGLLTIALGTGLLRPNVTTLVGQTQPDDQARRDAAFSLYYMCTNLGAFLAPLLVGSLAQSQGWHWGFATAGGAMATALILYVLGSRRRHRWYRRPPLPLQAAEIQPLLKRTLPAGVGATGLVLLHGRLRGFSAEGLAFDLFVLILVVAVLQLRQLWRTPGLTAPQRRRVGGVIVAFAASMVYFMIYTQDSGVLVTFVRDHADRSIGGWQIPTPWILSVNALGGIVFAPLFARLWLGLGGRAPGTAGKFAIAFVWLTASLLLLVPSGFQADAGQHPAILWTVVMLLLQTAAELLVIPVAMSATSHLAPPGLQARTMAVWYLSLSLGSALGGQLFDQLGQWGMGPFFLSLTALISAVALLNIRFLKPLNPLMV